MEKNEELRNKFIHIKSTNIWQRSQEYSEEKIVSLKNVLGKLDIHMYKKVRTLPYSTYKIEPKMDKS